MDRHSLFHRIPILFLLVISVSYAGVDADPVKAAQQHLQEINHNAATTTQELQRLQSDLTVILQEEPAVAAEYAKVAEELEQAFDKAKQDDKQAHDNAMIASFRFNRIDRKHTRFMDKKQEKLAAIESAQQQLEQMKQQLIVSQQQLAELKEQQINNQASMLAEKKRQAQLVAALAQQQKSQPAKLPEVKKTIKSAPKVSEKVVAPSWPSLDNPDSSDLKYARTELARLQALPKQSSSLGRVKLRSTCSDNKELEYLGEHIHSASLTVQGELCKFTLYNQDFWFTLPASQSKQYRLVYDTNSISSPQLFLFDEQLLLDTAK